ncbi:hypothetical protein C1645_813512 [Glomus cerebriforme]|uniref:Uncharacterized protein n=1 Tax=Glomus cerebriforme TaxID=658196 RepID=A0A397TSV3_9GLOM|nr:hypothetical protein C1645_813512 [Glomus cerebriforme]
MIYVFQTVNIYSKDRTEQHNSMMIIDNYNNKEKGKSKRIHSSNSEDEKDDIFKKIKLNNNKGIYAQSSNKVEFQYMQRNYVSSNDDDEACNNPNLHSEDQEELEIPEDEF